MSGNAFPNDIRRFYNEEPDSSHLLGVDTTARAMVVREGGYIVTALALAASERMWIRFGNGAAVADATAPSEPAAGDVLFEHQVFLDATITSFLVYIRPGVNTGVSAILDSGVATRSLTFTRTGQ